MGTPNYQLNVFESGSTASFYTFIRAMMGYTGTDSSNMEIASSVIQSLLMKVRFIRQGGSSTVWNTPGVASYVPQTMYVQYGNAATIDFPNGLISVTFPYAFANVPLLFVMPESNVGNGINIMKSITVHSLTATGFEARHKYLSTVPQTIDESTAEFDISIVKTVLSHAYWLAIGLLT